MESAGTFDHFSVEEDDEDLEDDEFSSGSMSFNGRLVISGEPIIFPVLGTAGNLKSKAVYSIFALSLRL